MTVTAATKINEKACLGAKLGPFQLSMSVKAYTHLHNLCFFCNQVVQMVSNELLDPSTIHMYYIIITSQLQNQ